MTNATASKLREKLKEVAERGLYAPGEPVERFTTGSLSLDLALGGGIPKGRIGELYGFEQTGKTTIALTIAKNFGGTTVYLDPENGLDANYVNALGANSESIILCQPDFAEQCFDIMDTSLRNGAGLVVMDSVASLVPQSEIEEGAEALPAAVARIMSDNLRKVSALCAKTNATVLFLNQLRESFSTGGWGKNYYTPGGNALRFYTSFRIELRNLEVTNDFRKTKAIVTKNKTAPPRKTAEIKIVYGKGLEEGRDVVDLLVQAGFVTKGGGGWLSFPKVGIREQGGQNFQKAFNQLPEEKQDKIVKAAMKKIGQTND